MPWRHTSPMDQKTQFIADYLRNYLSVTELGKLYGVRPKTSYKWIDRSLTYVPQGLRSHQMVVCPLLLRRSCRTATCSWRKASA
jgi:transposase-like protein